MLLFCGLLGGNIVGTMAGAMRTGLNYSGVESAMRIYGIKSQRRAALFRDIQIMERAALDVFIDEASARRVITTRCGGCLSFWGGRQCPSSETWSCACGPTWATTSRG